MAVKTSDNPNGAGRPTDLTEKLLKEIKQCILDGKNLKETATEIFTNSSEVSEKEKGKGIENYIQKIYNWNGDNYLNLGDKIEGWRRDRKLILAEGVIEEMLLIPVTTLKWQGKGEDAEEVCVTDAGLVRVKADMGKFVTETLGKKHYAKRSELTGADGKDLIPIDAEAKKRSDETIKRYLNGRNSNNTTGG